MITDYPNTFSADRRSEEAKLLQICEPEILSWSFACCDSAWNDNGARLHAWYCF